MLATRLSPRSTAAHLHAHGNAKLIMLGVERPARISHSEQATTLYIKTMHLTTDLLQISFYVISIVDIALSHEPVL